MDESNSDTINDQATRRSGGHGPVAFRPSITRSLALLIADFRCLLDRTETQKASKSYGSIVMFLKHIVNRQTETPTHSAGDG